LEKLSDEELVQHQLSANDWYVRHARRLLQERGGKPAMHEVLGKIAFGQADETRRLRGLWALHVTGGLTPELQLKGLADASAHVRAWTVQLACENGKPSDAFLERMQALAATDVSPVVRLYLASALQRLPLERRWALAKNLVAHAEDQGDHNLPLMNWYAVE